MLDRVTPPPSRISEMPCLTPPQCRRLSNGIPLFIFQNKGLELIQLVVSTRAGVVYEPMKRLASFCNNLLIDSHPDMSAEKFEEFRDYAGITLSVDASWSHSHLSVIFPRRNSQALKEVLQIILHPCFRKEELERYRARTIRDWEYDTRKGDFRSAQLIRKLFFGDELPFSKIADHRDFEIINTNHLNHYFKQSYCAENMSIFITGHVTPEVTEMVEGLFSGIRHGEPMRMMSCDNGIRPPQRIHETMPDALQTSIALCRRCPTANDPEIHAFRFFNTLFGNYFGSRLMQNLREKNGYTYGIGSTISHFPDRSICQIASEVNNDKCEAAIQACFDEMRRLREEPVGKEEMDEVRNFLYGSALRGIDGSVQLMRSYIGWHEIGYDEQRFIQYYDTIGAITADDVQRLANQWLREEDFSVVTVGQ